MTRIRWASSLCWILPTRTSCYLAVSHLPSWPSFFIYPTRMSVIIIFRFFSSAGIPLRKPVSRNRQHSESRIGQVHLMEQLGAVKTVAASWLISWARTDRLPRGHGLCVGKCYAGGCWHRSPSLSLVLNPCTCWTCFSSATGSPSDYIFWS